MAGKRLESKARRIRRLRRIGRLGGLKGGPARARILTDARKAQIARMGGLAKAARRLLKVEFGPIPVRPKNWGA